MDIPNEISMEYCDYRITLHLQFCIKFHGPLETSQINIQNFILKTVERELQHSTELSA
jgi:hypothetical protein